MTRRNIDIPDDLWHWVSVAAAEQGKPKRKVVEESLREYKERREGKQEGHHGQSKG